MNSSTTGFDAEAQASLIAENAPVRRGFAQLGDDLNAGTIDLAEYARRIEALHARYVDIQSRWIALFGTVQDAPLMPVPGA